MVASVEPQRRYGSQLGADPWAAEKLTQFEYVTTLASFIVAFDASMLP